MTETQKRIQTYKDALPGLKERVAAVALLLVMSLAMMTSASFAWLTISKQPEVTGVSTTMTANGNLEIALVNANGNRPEESAVGDSTATKGKAVTAANITWGNLVNLSDPSYGLENLVLRPAQLNTASLLNSPLYGAMYGKDGRITQLNSEFAYSIWNMPSGDKPGYFGVSNDYGVRAISSTKIEAVGADIVYANMLTTAKNQNLAAANMYVALGNNSQYMNSLANMMGTYMTAKLNDSDPSCSIEDIQNLRDMYGEFLQCYDAEAQAIASTLNIQQFLMYGEGAYTPYTVEAVYATTEAKLKGEGLKITNLNQFNQDHARVLADYQQLVDVCSSGASLTWEATGLNTIVNNLCNVSTCTLDGTPIGNIGVSSAMSYLSGTREARITNGILYRFEERTGGYLDVKSLKISVKLVITASVKANIQTSAPRDYNLFTNDFEMTKSDYNTGTFKGGTAVAQDTYGLAVDLWVRTNASSSYLTLEGNVLTESHEVRATGTDANGNSVDLYTVTYTSTDEEGNTLYMTVDLYKSHAQDESGKDVEVWRDVETHSIFTEEDLNGATPNPKMETVETVLGYEGENRVWDDNKTLSVDSTTQGSGSCYVYYADTPEDQARSLKLLESFNVAFVDETGKLIGKAIMDTEHFYAENGRVIVPLILDPGSSADLGMDINGNQIYGLMPLNANVPTRITAIVYLDGTRLTNQDVLAAADIQGQLNIQFGSSQNLKPINNEALEGAERRVSASIDNTHFDYDTANGPMTTTVTVRVDGDAPGTVTAFFLRSISDTQGSREQTMRFEPTDSGEFVATHTFTAPGTYVLRTVRLDGVDYDLSEVQQVVVEGFALEYLRCAQAADNNVHVMTAGNSHTVDLELKFAADNADKLPRSVAGRYLREDGTAVNVSFKMNPTTQIWSGSATFLTSGTYTLQYLVLDDKYTELPSTLWQTANLTLGMRVAVFTTSPTTPFKYVPSEMADNQKLLAMQVKILDNAGKEKPGLEGVKLTYAMKGSSVRKMDADLIWNGTYYVGSLDALASGAGIWQFSNVVVGSNTLTTATESPVFTILSPEPPEYYAHRTASYQYAPDNNAVFNVQITNSASAACRAYIIKDGASEGVWVNGALGTELTTDNGKTANNWNFAVPKDANGYQDGRWTLTTLEMWDVFAADGTAYTEEEPLVFDVSNTNNKSKVVCKLNIAFKENLSADFGKNASGTVTGTFMTGYDVSGLVVTIEDFEHQPISGVTDMKLNFVYNNDSKTYGGYTGANLNNALADTTIEFVANADNAREFVQKETKTFRYAGSYTTSFSYSVNGTAYNFSGDTLPANAPKFTVSSVVPTAKITAASDHTNKEGKTSSKTETSATVYFGSAKGGCDSITNYTQPHVTITLAGYGSANDAQSGATLTFTESNNGTVRLYESNGGSTAVSTYTWKQDGTCQRYVGYYKSKSAQSDDHTIAGTLKATELVMSYGGNSYTVDIADITISNPA